MKCLLCFYASFHVLRPVNKILLSCKRETKKSEDAHRTLPSQIQILTVASKKEERLKTMPGTRTTGTA